MDRPPAGQQNTHYLNPSTLKIKNSFRKNKKKEDPSSNQGMSPTTLFDKKIGINPE